MHWSGICRGVAPLFIVFIIAALLAICKKNRNLSRNNAKLLILWDIWMIICSRHGCG